MALDSDLWHRPADNGNLEVTLERFVVMFIVSLA